MRRGLGHVRHLVHPVGEFQGVPVGVEDGRDEIFGVDGFAEDSVHRAHQGREIRGRMRRLVDAQPHGMEQGAAFQGVLGLADGGDVHTHAGHARGVPLDVQILYGVPADEQPAAVPGHDLGVLLPGRGLCAALKDLAHGPVLVRRDEGLEPAAALAVLLGPAGELVQVGVGEGDTVFRVEGDGDEIDALQEVAEAVVGFDQGQFELLVPADVLDGPQQAGFAGGCVAEEARVEGDPDDGAVLAAHARLEAPDASVFVEQFQVALPFLVVDPEIPVDVPDRGHEFGGGVVAENPGQGGVGAQEVARGRGLGDALQGVFEDGAVACLALAEGVPGPAVARHVLERAGDDAGFPGLVALELGPDIRHSRGPAVRGVAQVHAEIAPCGGTGADLAQEPGAAGVVQKLQKDVQGRDGQPGFEPEQAVEFVGPEGRVRAQVVLEGADACVPLRPVEVVEPALEGDVPGGRHPPAFLAVMPRFARSFSRASRCSPWNSRTPSRNVPPQPSFFLQSDSSSRSRPSLKSRPVTTVTPATLRPLVSRPTRTWPGRAGAPAAADAGRRQTQLARPHVRHTLLSVE
jgi:hypothetical protein